MGVAALQQILEVACLEHPAVLYLEMDGAVSYACIDVLPMVCV